MPARDIQDLTQAELEAWCGEQGEAPYRARQVLTWVHRRGVTRFEEMANLPKLMRARLAEAFEVDRMRGVIGSPRITQPSSTATTGFTYAYVATSVTGAERSSQT